MATWCGIAAAAFQCRIRSGLVAELERFGSVKHGSGATWTAVFSCVGGVHRIEEVQRSSKATTPSSVRYRRRQPRPDGIRGIGGALTAADLHLDNVFADLLAHGRIKQGLRKAEAMLAAVERVLASEFGVSYDSD